MMNRFNLAKIGFFDRFFESTTFEIGFNIKNARNTATGKYFYFVIF
jgi:hypothetical protein